MSKINQFIGWASQSSIEHHALDLIARGVFVFAIAAALSSSVTDFFVLAASGGWIALRQYVR